jgi:Fe-S cluster biogenesis protein NfuA
MKDYEIDYYGFSNEDGDGCMAVFVAYPDIKGIGDTYEEAKEDAYERIQVYFKQRKNGMESFNLAVKAYESKQYERAYGLFEEAVEENSDAMVNLAFMHMKGNGCTPSHTKAKEWFEKAAEHDNGYALNSLAIFYEKGLGVRADEQLSFEYYKRAADAGHVDAQAKTGILYRQKGENDKAMQYLITAAHNNNAQAQEIITYVSNSAVSAERNEAFYGLDTGKQLALIENLIETKIRPTLASDGGGLELVNYIPGDTPQIWLSYLGACSGCHLGSTSTADMLLDHFETMIDKNVVLYLM